MSPLVVFLAAAIYEASAVAWAVAANQRKPERAALTSAVCAACMLVGVEGAMRGSFVHGVAFVAGYAFGTYVATRTRP